jgi:YggT family protein
MQIFLMTLCAGISGFISWFFILLTLRIYLGWFPNVNFYVQPFSFLGKMTDPYLRFFRGLIPDFIGFDFSPIAAFMLLSFVQDVTNNIAMGKSTFI